jgi:adenosylmethionine-8-amino-7-oxononanoate aminotransferase
MKEVCVKHGVLFILDEVMCGMGRTGFLHAWQEEGVVPDIQIVGKGLAGGYAPLSAVLIGRTITDALKNGPGNGCFSHGHTFQNFPKSCLCGFEVQRIIEEEGLVEKVRENGVILRQILDKRLKNYKYVGDIRGKGYFLGVSRFLCSLAWLTILRLNSCETRRPRSRLTPNSISRGNSTSEVRDTPCPKADISN